MLFDDKYRTVAAASEGIFTDRGSKFIGLIFPIASENEFKQHLQTIKKIHAKANHHCYAWRLSPARDYYKINDDGEPAGTAGRQILNALLSNNITNCAIIVIRYFGGTLLGVPGLIYAYKTTATNTIAAAHIIEYEIIATYALTFPYEMMNDVMRKLKAHHAVVISNETDHANCIVTFNIARKNENLLLDEMQNNHIFTQKVNIKTVVL